MLIKEKENLKNFNTFGVDAIARYFAVLDKEEDIKEIFSSKEFKGNRKLFIGGGSNILFAKDFDGIVILNKIKGIEVVKEDEENIWLKVYGGENWHEFVMFTVDHGYCGVENLSLIPGTVGATPIQNIGAYGVEIKDILESLEGYEIENTEKKIFLNKDCNFGYRDSVFKKELKDKFLISSVTLKLSKKPKFNTSYKILEKYLLDNKLETNLKNISDAVIAIRKSKLPDPKEIGNAGSFFKNVFVDQDQLSKLKEKWNDIPVFDDGGGIIKIPAGFLIESCGFKGKRSGDVGCYEKQALVLVNYGGASGKEIIDFAENIISEVKDKFGLVLEKEVNII